jgi:hypothetical protein
LQRATQNVLLAALSVTLTLVAVDVALRFTSIGSPRRGTLEPKPRPHLLTGRIEVFPPGYRGVLAARDFTVHVRANALGLRGWELDFADLARRHPVVFVGDSYVFGWGVEEEDRVSERSAALLGQAGYSVPVVNLSFPGWGMSQALEVLEDFAPRLRPRLVILGLFVGNDFMDDLAYRAASRKGPASATPGALAEAKAFVRRVLQGSPVVNLVNQALWRSTAFRGFFNTLEVRNDRIVLYEPRPSDAQRQLYAATLESLAGLARLSRKEGFEILVAIIPDHLQVLEPRLFAGYDLTLPQRTVSARARADGLLVVDLLRALSEAPDPTRLYFREDKHWTREGHSFVAHELLPAVTEALGPPSP